jgi:uncharacterized tellurite resistance protein B-like protein
MASLFHALLSQLEEKISKKNSVNEKAALIISAVLHTMITADQVTIQDTTLRIKAAPTVKMAIKLNTPKLLTALIEAGIEIKTIQ